MWGVGINREKRKSVFSFPEPPDLILALGTSGPFKILSYYIKNITIFQGGVKRFFDMCQLFFLTLIFSNSNWNPIYKRCEAVTFSLHYRHFNGV
jgi:hypothetical protein